METQRYCKFCGAELSGGARFCESCGERVPVAAAPEARTPDSESPNAVQPDRAQSTQPTTAAQPPSRRTAALLSVLAVLVLSGALAVWLVARESASPTNNTVDSLSVAPALEDDTSSKPRNRFAVTRVDIERLKAVVVAANAAHVDAIFASRDPSPDFQIQLNHAIGDLGQALHRYHVDDASGDISTARAEMRAFLESLVYEGIGLSEPIIDEGVAGVAP